MNEFESPEAAPNIAGGAVKQPSRFRKLLQKGLSAAAITAVAITGITIAAPAPAEAAAETGAGGAWSPYGAWLGNYVVNGVRVYCIDVNVDTIGSSTPQGVQSSITPVDGTRAVSGDDMKRLNYAISTWGQTGDPEQAAAVSAYVYGITSANNPGMDGHYIGGGAPAEVRTIYNKIVSDTSANFNRGGGEAGTGMLEFAVDPSNNYVGTAKVTASPTSSTGTLTLTNGIFTDTGKSSRSGVKNGDVFNVRGVAPEDGSAYKISGVAKMTGPGGTSYASNLAIFDDNAGVPGSNQRTAGPGTKNNVSADFEFSAADPGPRSSKFSPQVTTKVVSRFVKKGQTFSDELTFTLGKNADGTTNEWFRSTKSGDYAPITAVGTIYGPSNIPFTESDKAPAGVPVFETGVKVTTTATDGPNKPYVVSSKNKTTEAGYFTWVQEIKGSDQRETVQKFLDGGAKYNFTDRFGLLNETSITPSELTINTKLSKNVAGMGEEITDDVTVGLVEGAWLIKDGKRVPVTMRGTAYYVPEEPKQQQEVPADAVKLSETKLVVDKSGKKTSDPIEMPYKGGYVSLQWCVLDEDQDEAVRGYFEEKCDDFGIPAETTKVEAPKVTTKAKEKAPVYGDFNDTAIVDGFVPENSEIEFKVYKKPVAGDAKWKDGEKTEELWTAEEIAALGDNATCEATNLVTTTTRIPVKAGQNDKAEYDSPNVQFDETGTAWWVESLIVTPPGSETELVVHEGECGLANETTEVEWPNVTTKAVENAIPGDQIFDTAIVGGEIVTGRDDVKYEVTFEAFHRATGTTTEIDEALCTPETKVWESTKGTPVTKKGEFVSEKWTAEKKHLGEILFVETLWVEKDGGEKQQVHKGACGAASEITKVTETKPLALPNTGSENIMIAGGIAALVLLIGGASAIVIARRRKAAVAND